ncbi:MBL fold metallo-hydrolase [Kocuria coralli]|uniref:MBL fold metallo-hydrolase n=1 Tax=Kocuria coralli TaxID=1461025 RepID=A0A5J5L1H8_9MICC|nr:MBL fold metallo-hydrolase [Kocuria coralli]KAA9395428.1 MBL fold metallo-hydrolase [Kocuria coralli]
MTRQYLTDSVSVIRADNPGAMTLDGTNTWILQAPRHGASGGGGGAVVVDPGPDLEEHLDELVAAGPIELVLITHRHGDHTEAIAALYERTDAPVRAHLEEHCRDGEPLHGGEVLTAGGLQIQVIHTPGHTSDSLSFVITEDFDPDSAGRPKTMVLTGDTVLGRGTTMIDHPDGTLAEYLDTLDRLEALAEGPGPTIGLPGHGEPLADLTETCRMLREHRLSRIDQVREAQRDLGAGATVEQLTDHIYADVPEGARRAAMRSIEAQVAYLAL